MADNYSFDVVSRIDMQEMKNVVDQTLKEIGQRYDFKGSKSELTLKEKETQLVVLSDDDYKLNAVQMRQTKRLVKRVDVWQSGRSSGWHGAANHHDPERTP